MTKKKDPARTIEVEANNKAERQKRVAELFLKPTMGSASTIKDRYDKEDLMTIRELSKELDKQATKINEGDMTRAEDMLISHAHTLDSLFNEMVSRARLNMGEYMDAFYKYMNLAFKAQNQSRMTLSTLGEIKNPRPYIQNNRADYQQVNNGSTPSLARDENSKIDNELLEDKTDEQEWMDAGAPQTTSGNDKKLETVETQHRRKDGGRQGRKQDERL